MIRLFCLAVILLVTMGCSSCQVCDWDADHDGFIRIAVTGDSNSWQYAEGTPWPEKLWQELEDTYPGQWAVTNYAIGGSMITGHPTNSDKSGMTQIDAALLANPPYDLIIIAFGTVDHIVGKTNDEIMAAYANAILHIGGSGSPARVRLGTVPWCGSVDCDATIIAELNEDIRSTWPLVETIDFNSWVTPTYMLPDLIHFTAEGQQRRFEAVWDLLF